MRFKNIIAAAGILASTTFINAQSVQPQAVNKEHAEKFSKILVQDVQGRIKPMDSLSTDILNKVSRKREIDGLNYNQVVLGMMSAPQIWSQVPLITVKHPDIKRILGIGKNQTHAKFSDFFDDSRKVPYKINELVSTALRKPQAKRNNLDKEVLKIDELANICFMVFQGELFRMFPVTGDPLNKWYSSVDVPAAASESERNEIKNLYKNYIVSVQSAYQNGNWELADEKLAAVSSYQKAKGGDLLKSDTEIGVEIFFNKVNIFDRISSIYMLSGLILLIMTFIEIVYNKAILKIAHKIFVGIIGLSYAAHTFGLGLRWYISGHAPWSNGYESLIYIAWAMMGVGLFFGRNSILALSTAAVMSGISLWVAHLSWMDPQVTNLVPVLKSYWLTIHVSVISASYGFFSLAALLGLVALILMIFRNEAKPKVDSAIKHVLRIDEMAMLVGIAFIAIGNLLGAVWANESWGRYWSWDPKETWTFVSISLYAAVLHLKYIPRVNTHYVFATASLWGFSTILFTYFGVNYLISGLHSYL